MSSFNTAIRRRASGGERARVGPVAGDDMISRSD